MLKCWLVLLCEMKFSPTINNVTSVENVMTNLMSEFYLLSISMIKTNALQKKLYEITYNDNKTKIPKKCRRNQKKIEERQ